MEVLLSLANTYDAFTPVYVGNGIKTHINSGISIFHRNLEALLKSR